MTEAKMMEQCQEMKAHNAPLTEQITDMNCAPQDKKTDLMAAVVTHMVEQRIAVDARKGKRKEEMMQLMQLGKESMAKCPMMKGMKGVDEKSEDAHKEHQPEQK